MSLDSQPGPDSIADWCCSRQSSQGPVRSVAYSPDRQHIISGSGDRTIRIWDAETDAAVGEPLEGHAYTMQSTAYSPDGQHIVSGSQDHTVHVRDAFQHLSIQPSPCDLIRAGF